MGQPVLAEQTLVHLVDPVLLNGLEPDQLKVQIVIGHRLSAEVLRVEGDIEQIVFSFHGSAEGSADIFSCPASEDLVAVLLQTEEAFSRSLRVKHNRNPFVLMFYS